MFILYWALGLKPVDDHIRLFVINYDITNPSVLVWIANLILFYFAWRFHLNSKRQIIHGYRKSFNYHQFNNKNSILFTKLKKKSVEHYVENHKSEFESQRLELSKGKQIEGFNNKDYSIYPTKFVYNGSNLVLSYQARYDGSKVPGNDFKNSEIRYQWNDWLWLKAYRFILFIIGKEEAPDYLLPWVMFYFALLCSVMTCLEISVNELG